MSSQLIVVLGTRPEIIKLAPIINECEERGVSYCVIHTGQHYSEHLSEKLFQQLDLPKPDYTLAVGSDSHGHQTGLMLAQTETVLAHESPAVVLVQGDTNSALAGALAASKLETSLAHVEAGLRSFTSTQPEEVNRRLIDHAADMHFAPTKTASQNLRNEGISLDQITVTGNTVTDAIRLYQPAAERKSTVINDLGLAPTEFLLLTVHRAENIESEHRFASLLKGVDRFAQRRDVDVIYPAHPHALKKMDNFDLEVPSRIRVVDPLGYFDFLCMESAADLVFTDSGGIQEEACVLGTPCVTLREATERPETLKTGSNALAGTDPERIVAAAAGMDCANTDWQNPFGDGTTARQILSELKETLSDVEAEAPVSVR